MLLRGRRVKLVAPWLFIQTARTAHLNLWYANCIEIVSDFHLSLIDFTSKYELYLLDTEDSF
jgi:hypothetical protein